MRPIRQVLTGVGATPLAAMDTLASPFNATISVEVTGTVTYTVEVTTDDVLSTTAAPGSAVWFAHPNLSALTASAIGNVAFPVTAIRLRNTAGTGTSVLTILQTH